MRLSGLKNYLSKPPRAVITSLVLAAAAVLLMFIFKPVFPDKTAIFRPQSPGGAVEVEPGGSIEVKFRSFTEFDEIGFDIFADSPSKEYEGNVSKISEDYYKLTIKNTGTDVLRIMLESPLVYKAIEPLEDGGTVDLHLFKNGSPNGMIFAYVTLFTALFVFFVSFAFLTDNLTPSKFYLIGAITLGLGVYPVLFPAWTAHDSDAHFQAAYRFSNILLGKGSGWVARECDVEFFRGSWKRFVYDGGYRPNPAGDIYLPVVLNNDIFVSADKTAMVPSDGADYSYMLFYGIFNYLPLSAGLALGRLMRLSPMYIIHLARYLQGVLFVFLTWRSIRKVKSQNVAYLLTLVSLFPMSLCYITAFSYDGPVLTYVICSFAQLYCFKEDEDSRTTKNIIEAIIWFFLVGSVKGGAYVILIPVVFMLLAKPLKSRRNILPFILAAAAFAGILVSNVLLKPRGEQLFQLTGGDGFFSADFALYHPFKYLMMCFFTLCYFSGEIITDSVGRCEGWNEEAIPVAIIVIILTATVVSVIASEKVSKVTRPQAVSFVAAILLFFIGTPAMLLHDTPVDYILIMGVQGRYFRPAAPLIIMLFVGLVEFLSSKLEPKSLEKLTARAGVVRSAGLLVFAVGTVASVIAMMNLYLGR